MYQSLSGNILLIISFNENAVKVIAVLMLCN